MWRWDPHHILKHHELRLIRAIRQRNNAIPAQSNNNAIEKQEDTASAAPGEGLPYHFAIGEDKKTQEHKTQEHKETSLNEFIYSNYNTHYI